MGKPTGFLEYERINCEAEMPSQRIQHFSEFHSPLSPEEVKKQGGRCMECGVPFCQAGTTIGGMTSGCPLHNLVPEWNDLLYRNNWKEAYKRLHATNNFPEFTGRVCPALCEAACTCNLNGEPVSSKNNELSIIERAFQEGYIQADPPAVRTGKKVAIVGSGPAGLSAAVQLNGRGHEVTVFERKDRIGGLLRYGIPNMKLEKSVIDRRLSLMEAEGICFMPNVEIKTAAKAKKIEESFDAIILACGASNPRDLDAPGRDAKGIYFAVDFLTGVTKSLLDSDLQDKTFVQVEGKQVVVIGGGDTGNDCVGTALRLGAKDVVQLEMMPQAPESRSEGNPWPQWPLVSKTDYGQEEAIALLGRDPRQYQTTVTAYHKNKKGELQGITVVDLEAKRDKQTGRLQMVQIPDSEREMAADVVLIAAGFLGAEGATAKAFGVELDPRTNVATKPGSYQTNVSKVFAAGDMHRGQSLVVWAIQEGREVAKEVDTALMGYSNFNQ